MKQSKFEIIKQDNVYEIHISGVPVTTPSGMPVSAANKPLIELIVEDLESNTQMDASVFGYYSMFCTYREFFEGKNITLKKEDFKKAVKADFIMHTVAGPELVQQMSHYEPLNSEIEAQGLENIQFGGKENLDKIVDYFLKQFNALNDAQKTAVINSTQVFGTILYGILLVSEKCTPYDYGKAYAAANAIIPEVFADVTEEDYEQTILGMEKKAEQLLAFARLFDKK